MIGRAPPWRWHSGRERHVPGLTWYCSSDYIYSMALPADASPTVFVDVSDTIDRKIEAMKAAWASTDLPDDFEEHQRVAHGNSMLYTGLRYAEVFESQPATRQTVEYLS